jgi:hypothetical protein
VVVALIVFYFLFNLNPDDLLLARAFYVWISVFNLLIGSVFWSLMANLFNPEQGSPSVRFHRRRRQPRRLMRSPD